MRIAFFAIGLLFVPHDARAEGTANQLLRIYEMATLENRKEVEQALAARQDGMAWVNGYLKEVRKESATYCPPGKMAITGGQLVDILKRQVQASPQIGEYPFGLAMLYSLQQVFPCDARASE